MGSRREEGKEQNMFRTLSYVSNQQVFGIRYSRYDSYYTTSQKISSMQQFLWFSTTFLAWCLPCGVRYAHASSKGCPTKSMNKICKSVTPHSTRLPLETELNRGALNYYWMFRDWLDIFVRHSAYSPKLTLCYQSCIWGLFFRNAACTFLQKKWHLRTCAPALFLLYPR